MPVLWQLLTAQFRAQLDHPSQREQITPSDVLPSMPHSGKSLSHFLECNSPDQSPHRWGYTTSEPLGDTASIWLAAYKYLTLSGLNWKRRIIEVSHEITGQVIYDPIRLTGHVPILLVCSKDTLCEDWREEAGNKAEPCALHFCYAVLL